MTQHDIWSTWEGKQFKYIYIYILKVHFFKFQSNTLGLRVCRWKCTQVSLYLFLRLLACGHNWPTLPVMWTLAWFVCLLSLSCSTNTKKWNISFNVLDWFTASGVCPECVQQSTVYFPWGSAVRWVSIWGKLYYKSAVFPMRKGGKNKIKICLYIAKNDLSFQ